MGETKGVGLSVYSTPTLPMRVRGAAFQYTVQAKIVAVGVEDASVATTSEGEGK